MEKRLIALAITTTVFCISCKKVDISGFFINPDQVNERVLESFDWNDTHSSRDLSVPFTDYSLLIAGDSHVGSVRNLDTLIARAHKPECAGFAIVGDITTGQKEDFDRFRDELDSKNQKPAFLMVGNHDLYFGGWKYFYSYFGSSTYAFKITSTSGTDLYICLDSGSGTIGSRQLEWLKDILDKERSLARHCIIMSHVNFFRQNRTFSTNPLVDELHVMMDLCYRYAVDMVIMGHDHNRSTNALGYTRFITLDALADYHDGASYLKLDIRNSGLSFSFVEL